MKMNSTPTHFRKGKSTPARLLAAGLLGFVSAGFGAAPAGRGATEAELTAMAHRFAPTPIEVATDQLSAGDRKAIVKLIAAARILDDLFLDQKWSGNKALLAQLKKDTTPLGKARLEYFRINKGPWSDLEENKAFVPGVPARKPLGANFYPLDLTTKMFDAWAGGLALEEARDARGFYSVIVRKDKNLVAVPYSEAYREPLTRCAALLREAAALTDNATLQRFLTTRADAFASNDYYASDVAWMDLDAPLDITIGPYETYQDELFGYKAAFEAYVNVRDDAETKKLAYFSDHLQTIEDNLPEDPKYRAAKLGALSPIRIVNEVFASGDASRAVKSVAYNLPNDDRVVQEKGSKRVMLKNLQEAKFANILTPIAQQVLIESERQYLSFEWFFTHILAHELMHGLGPHQITIDGRETNPRLELKSAYGTIEEAKADITGLWALQFMLDHAKEMGLERVVTVDADAERKLYTTYLASMFRTLRFGQAEAHGRGMALQFNFLLDRKALTVTKTGEFEIDYAKIKDAVRDLDTFLLTLEAKGDLAGAKKAIDAATIRPEVAKALERIKHVPVDIDPVFVTADRLSPP